MRLSVGLSTEVDDFMALGATSVVLAFTPGADARRQCEAYELPTAPLQMRLVRVTFKGGETEVLATLLHDEEAFPAHFFKQLYSANAKFSVSSLEQVILKFSVSKERKSPWYSPGLLKMM